MSQKKKKSVRRSSPQAACLRKLMDDYAAATGKKVVNAYKAAEWALAHGYQFPRPDLRKLLAKAMARAAREDYIEDEEGQPVRARLSYKVSMGEEQLTLWVNMADASPRQMRLSAQGRRRGILKDVEQLDRDLKYYNKHYNPGDPVTMIWDLTKDMEEKGESSEYQDVPPEEEDENGEEGTPATPTT